MKHNSEGTTITTLERLAIESGTGAVAVRVDQPIPELEAEPGDVITAHVLGDRVRVGRIRDFGVRAGGAA